MRILLVCCSLVMSTFVLWSQERALPPDFRQHNLTQFNANLLNAAFGPEWNRPNSLSLWTRWQWQTIDADPSSIFANYTHQLNQQSVLGIGFLQHNTGTYVNTGGNINYSYIIQLKKGAKLIFGTNFFVFQEKLKELNSTMDESANDFILQFSPGVRLRVNQFNIGLALERALDFNFSENERESMGDARIVTGILSNDFPVSIFSNDGGSFVRPMVYIRAIPDEDTQFGVNGLFSTPKFWVQGGYNSFYGVSGGLGATFAKKF